ncbi:hypothetical protein [Paenibacillus sp. P32E]|uniref:hypothetical protein n=1 Tax=Paenibacillus sp. P32E TaxID=1349434 RepID=UPI0015C07FE4|nr:hypothetical protein [Paenibacillus sp. P32E]
MEAPQVDLLRNNGRNTVVEASQVDLLQPRPLSLETLLLKFSLCLQAPAASCFNPAAP